MLMGVEVSFERMIRETTIDVVQYPILTRFNYNEVDLVDARQPTGARVMALSSQRKEKRLSIGVMALSSQRKEKRLSIGRIGWRLLPYLRSVRHLSPPKSRRWKR